MKVEIDCCGGREDSWRSERCAGTRCPVYKLAYKQVHSRYQYIETGFGPLVNLPDHEDYLREVRQILEELVRTEQEEISRVK